MYAGRRGNRELSHILFKEECVSVSTMSSDFFYKEDLLTNKNLQKYATKYIHMYNIKYNKMAA